MANENDIPTEADQLRTAVQEGIKEIATLRGKVAERDDSEKKLLAAYDTAKKELLEEVRAAHFEERTS